MSSVSPGAYSSTAAGVVLGVLPDGPSALGPAHATDAVRSTATTRMRPPGMAGSRPRGGARALHGPLDLLVHGGPPPGVRMGPSPRTERARPPASAIARGNGTAGCPGTVGTLVRSASAPP